MKRLFEWDEFEDEQDDVDLTMFTDLTSYPALKKYKPIEFLRSLNLTKEQYKKLADIFIDVYGYERWEEGNDRGYQQGYESASENN
jgi:hypothetical protein